MICQIDVSFSLPYIHPWRNEWSEEQGDDLAVKLLKRLSLIYNVISQQQKNTYILWRCPLTTRDLFQLRPRTPYVLTQLLIPVTSTSTKVYKTYLWSSYHLTPTTAPPHVLLLRIPRAASADDGQGSLDLVSPMYSWLPCAALVSLHPTVVGKGDVWVLDMRKAGQMFDHRPRVGC